jgi:hypothetical protein
MRQISGGLGARAEVLRHRAEAKTGDLRKDEPRPMCSFPPARKFLDHLRVHRRLRVDEHDLVGIFVAPSIYDLALILDEGIDPGVCEYQRLGAGGIMWTGEAVAVPIDLSADEEGTGPDPIPWSEATLTEGWEDSVYGEPKGNWRALYPDETLSSEDPPPSPTEPAETGTARILPYRKRGT